MCTALDGKSYELFQLLVQFYEELRNEATRTGLFIDSSKIDRVIREGRDLVYAPVHPTKLTRKNSDEDLTGPVRIIILYEPIIAGRIK